MLILTKAQRNAVWRKWMMMDEDTRPSYREFRKAVQPTFGMDGAIVLPWCGMWLAIERDGYTHS